MKRGLLIAHQGEDFFPLTVISADASDDDIDRVILASLSKWACPPKDFVLVHGDDVVAIVYKSGYQDDNDGLFITTEIDVDL